ncbi:MULTISPECIES: hypothetical protein [unclassified Bacillus (in: firmicutes)]|uniref:hypothetical protein n=1 Tax=unclassified Bacillus (in: firmicutes) TaxID=185979 RepID=UPI0008E65753|nr:MULTISPECIES: hypothetical protein [unclassified Bacillus (in: firmicutes)]SFA99834.1 hypothetical protein SAMN02799634_103475 [Bacillus sp. UNCCL13]SFQ81820.1 hypothetical protein SAMN04488577_2106 [Bacillus sp. cl95]
MKRFAVILLIYILICHTGKAYAADRLVTSYIISDKWYDDIFLIADKAGSMATRNFTLQVGSGGGSVGGELIYNFPNWYNDKFAPKLFYEDINDDELKDIMVVLISGAGSGLSTKENHILNQVRDPNQRFEEVPVEPIDIAVKKLVKMKRNGNIASISIGKVEHNVDISKFQYLPNTIDPNPSVGQLEDYSIENGILTGSTVVFISPAGQIGDLRIEYGWDGKIYKAKSVSFKEAEPL